MIEFATQTEVDSYKNVIDELRKKYLPLLDTIGDDLLGDYKAFELPHIIKKIKDGNYKTILDFGAGTSCLPAYLDNLGYDVYCLDLPSNSSGWHPEVTEESYNKVYKSKVHYIKEDILTVPTCIPDDTFDVIYSASVLEHIPNYEEYLKILDKKLKKGGLHIHVMDAIIPDDIYQPEKGMGRLVITR